MTTTGRDMFVVLQTELFVTWLEALADEHARTGIRARVGRLERGLFGDSKSVGDGVSEMRVDCGPGYRLYYARRGRTVVILLSGGDKDSQARDSKLARVLMRKP